MTRKLFSVLLGCLVAASFVVPAFAADNLFLPTTAGSTFNWNTAGNWSDGGVPDSTDDVRITNTLSAAGVLVVTGSVAGTTINFMEIGSTAGASVNQTNKLIIGDTFTSSFGMINNARGVVEITNTTVRFGINEFVTFSNSGSLILRDGGLLILNSGGIKPLVNAGTIVFNTATTADINYGQTPSFTNLVGGTVVKLGPGTGTFTGEFGGANRAFYNAGTILIQGGALAFDPRDAFADGGFRNLSTGFIRIETASTGIVNRTANAWNNSAPPVNFGTIEMAGGFLRTFAGGAFDVSRIISNAAGARIQGFGTLDFNVANVGVVEARSGTLTLGRMTGNAGTWVSTNFGGVASVLNFASFTGGGLFDLGAGTLINTGGGIRVAGGANVTLSTSYRDNAGTIDFAGAGIIFQANVAGLTAITNSLVVKKTATGSSTITTGYALGDPGNYGFVNRGTITAGGGATLTLNTGDATANPLSNAPTGVIEITTAASQFQYRRTANAWDTGTEAPVNAGTIAFVIGSGGGGTFSLLRDNAVTPTQFIRNIGVIETRTTATAGTSTFNASVSNTVAGTINVTNATLRNLRFVGANEGTIGLRGPGIGTLEIGVPFFTNAGTIVFSGGVFAYTNVAGGSAFHNLAGGVISNISGSGTLLLGFGAGENNYSLVNLGSLVASAGTLTINSSNAFANGGFSNAASGRVVIDAGATLRIQRTEAAWTGSDPAAVNVGVITLNGGSLETFDGALNSARFLRNVGTITGFGTISAQILNVGSEVIATNGLLVIANPAGTIVTNSAAGTYRAAGTGLRFNTGPATGTSNDFVNLGRFNYNSGTIAVGNFVNVGTFNAAHSGHGTIFVSAGSLFTNAPSGSIFVSSGTTQVARTTVNLGVIDTYGSGGFGVIDGQNFTNAVGGLILNTNAAATLSLRAAADRFLNQGTMVVSNNATIQFQNNTLTGTGWRNTNTVILGSATSFGVINSGTINNDGTIRGTGTINLGVGSPPNAPRPIVQSGTGHLIVTNGDLTITHLSINRLSIGGGTLTVSGGNTLRIFSDLAATTNAILLNSAQVRLFGGTIISANITNNPSGTIRGFGTLSFNNGPLPGSVSNLYNAGTIMAEGTGSPLVLNGAFVFNETNAFLGADTGRLLVMGSLINRGTVSFLNSVGTFNSTVVNLGTWITDPTTNVFVDNFTNDTSGVIVMADDDVFIFTNDADSVGSFLNRSTNNVANSTPGKFLFSATLALTQELHAAGHDLHQANVTDPTNQIDIALAPPGYATNFSIGTLEIANFSTVRVFDAFITGGIGTNDDLRAALYVTNLFMGANSFLIISSNVSVYFINSNAWGAANFTLLGGPVLGNMGQLHQFFVSELAVIPEPSVLLMWLAGLGTLYGARRRARRTARAD